MKPTGNHLLFLIITIVITLLPLIIGLFTWAKLPDSVAIHFGIDGTPNGWAPKWVVVFLIPLVLAAIQIAVYFSTEAALAKGSMSMLYYSITMLIAPLCALICSVIIYLKALK